MDLSGYILFCNILSFLRLKDEAKEGSAAVYTPYSKEACILNLALLSAWYLIS